jgi:predicted transcriptional regulator of viral defense system
MDPLIRRTADLRAAGYDRDELRRMVRSGALVAVRRGAYVTTEPDDADVRYVLAVRAAVLALADGAVVSHVSAAALHGLPLWGLRRTRVHVTYARGNGGRCGTHVHVHTAPLAADEIVISDGLAATSLARTVVDIARTASFTAAVAVVDAALHAGLDPAALSAALDRARGWPGVPVARRVVAFADGRSESVGESRSRVAIAAAGLPPPELQWPVRLDHGTAYTDFAWPELRTVGEFDGRVKYGRLLRPGQQPGDVVHAEKLREDAVRAQDWEMVRWTWADLTTFDATAARLRKRFRC